MSERVWISRAIVFETSSDQCSNVLNATTRTGSLNCPDMRSAMIVSRSVRSTSVFAVNAAVPSEVINHEIDDLVRAVWHDPWCPTDAGHAHLLRNKRNRKSIRPRP